jgi:hypothetical protein
VLAWTMTAARVDNSRQRHQASETTGQTQATATAGIIAVRPLGRGVMRDPTTMPDWQVRGAPSSKVHRLHTFSPELPENVCGCV